MSILSELADLFSGKQLPAIEKAMKQPAQLDKDKAAALATDLLQTTPGIGGMLVAPKLGKTLIQHLTDALTSMPAGQRVVEEGKNTYTLGADNTLRQIVTPRAAIDYAQGKSPVVLTPTVNMLNRLFSDSVMKAYVAPKAVAGTFTQHTSAGPMLNVGVPKNTPLQEVAKIVAHEGSHIGNLLTGGPAGGDPLTEFKSILRALPQPMQDTVKLGQIETNIAAQSTRDLLRFLDANGIGSLTEAALSRPTDVTVPAFIRNSLTEQPHLQQLVSAPIRALYDTQISAYKQYRDILGEVEARGGEAMIEKALQSSDPLAVYKQDPSALLDTPLSEIISRYYPPTK